MNNIPWYLLFITTGIALDWAMSERLKASLEYFLKKGPFIRYRDALFPRILFTLPAVALVAYATAQPITNTVLFFIGLGVFLISLIYGLNKLFTQRA